MCEHLETKEIKAVRLYLSITGVCCIDGNEITQDGIESKKKESDEETEGDYHPYRLWQRERKSPKEEVSERK